MELLKEITIKQGSLYIFGGRPGMGLSRLTIKIANEIASTNRVLFVSYQTYKENVSKIITEQGSTRNQNLIIDTALPFNLEGLEQLKKYIKLHKISHIFIDDLDSFMGDVEQHDGNDEIINSFHQLTLELEVAVILNVTVSSKAEKRNGIHKPLLRDFNWARNIIDLSHQVYSIYRSEYYGIVEDENGESMKGIIEVTCLKDLKNEGHSIIIDNNKEKIL